MGTLLLPPIGGADSERENMQTTSGARLTVVKTAEAGPARERLFAQAEWLKSFNDEHIVRVLTTHADGYEMEFLESPRDAQSTTSRTRDVLNILEAVVWIRPVRAHAGPQMKDYVNMLDARVGGTRLADWCDELARNEYDYCDTHDLMYRDGVPVLIDPLPDVVTRGDLPSCKALDMGKVLQSALGYERVKNGGSTWYWDGNIAYDVRERCRDVAEWNLACLFAAIHVVRFIPYQTPMRADLWRAWFPDIFEVLHS